MMKFISPTLATDIKFAWILLFLEKMERLKVNLHLSHPKLPDLFLPPWVPSSSTSILLQDLGFHYASTQSQSVEMESVFSSILLHHLIYFRYVKTTVNSKYYLNNDRIPGCRMTKIKETHANSKVNK